MTGPNDFEEAMKKFKQARNAAHKEFKGKGPSKKLIVTILFGLFAIWGALTTFYRVDEGEEAVVLRLGKYLKTLGPGPHFRIPFNIDTVYVLRTKQDIRLEFGFRTKRTRETRTEYERERFDHESKMLTGDLNIVDVDWVVQYRIRDPFKYLYKIKNPRHNPAQNVRDISETVMRQVVGDWPVDKILTEGKTEIEKEAEELMQKILDSYDVGIKISNLKLQDVNPPEQVQASYEDVEVAKQESDKLINEAKKKFNQVIPEARGKAEKTIAEAQGFATAIVAKAQGDADRFSEMLNAYRRAPKITKKRIYLETMENLFSSFENLVIVDSTVKGLLPIFNQSLNSGGKK